MANCFGVWLFFFFPNPEEKANDRKKRQFFVCLIDRLLGDLVEGTQVKTTKYATKYAVHIFPR